jgi:hypothetical protein
MTQAPMMMRSCGLSSTFSAMQLLRLNRAGSGREARILSYRG